MGTRRQNLSLCKVLSAFLLAMMPATSQLDRRLSLSLRFSLPKQPEPVAAYSEPTWHIGQVGVFVGFNIMQLPPRGNEAGSTSASELSGSWSRCTLLLCKAMLYLLKFHPHVRTLVMKATFSTWFWPWEIFYFSFLTRGDHYEDIILQLFSKISHISSWFQTGRNL